MNKTTGFFLLACLVFLGSGAAEATQKPVEPIALPTGIHQEKAELGKNATTEAL